MAKSTLPRGFKAEAERIALNFRKDLELESYSALCGFELAKHLNISVHHPHDFFPTEFNIEDLVGSDNGWSAVTLKTKNGRTIIIHNHTHSPARQQSNLMHELAHIIRKHERPAAQAGIKLPLFMREFDKLQEEEAGYLGSALQIPREGLIWALKKRMNNDEVAEHFKASALMVTHRINATGVKKQLGYLFK